MTKLTEQRVREIAREVYAEESAKQAEVARAQIGAAVAKLRTRTQAPVRGDGAPAQCDDTGPAGRGTDEQQAMS
ncbi:hypothetical protein [Nocardia farcinica]